MSQVTFGMVLGCDMYFLIRNGVASHVCGFKVGFRGGLKGAIESANRPVQIGFKS